MCTAIRFTDDEGRMYFGRNLDWVRGYGERVIASPSTAVVPAAFARSGDRPVGRDVIGMGFVFEGFPLYFDCGNDAGLAVAGLNFPQSARYADSCVDGSINVAAYEFPFWVARNFSSVDEIRRALPDVNIVGVPLSPQLPVANLHWLIGDAVGSIVVECMDDGVHVWDNDVDVLSNEPDYGWNRINLRNYLTLENGDPSSAAWGDEILSPFGSGMGMHGIPGDFSGPSRFVKAAFVNTHYPVQTGEGENVARLYRTLATVAVPEGCVKTASGAYEKTLYTSCFSSSSMTYYHASYADLQVRAYPFAGADRTSSTPVAVPPVA